MAERKRSKDMSRDTDKVFGKDDKVSQAGRAGGELSRKVGTRDEKKRAFERPAGATRVTKSDEIEEDTDNG
ncbi:hypothetical protein [Tropicibacter alexandrii]|uniref:hypothetical protein n=1 Tax=Tropicibacter alexandrii TaxID=2267683 RepID=UPI000EF444BE|nr:hypothetical protein [Tropicibacter alexandrii]